MRKSSKAVSLLLSGLMATSCFSMAAVSASAADTTDQYTNLADRIAAGHQIVYFHQPTAVWGNLAGSKGVKMNAKKHTVNVFCNYYAIYGNQNEVKTRSWEAPSTSMYKEDKTDTWAYFDITASGQGEMEEGAEYGILFSTKANKGDTTLLQPNADGFQTCDMYFNKSCLGPDNYYYVDEPAQVRENTANSQKIDYYGHSANGVGAPLKKVSTLCAYIDGINPGNTPASLEMANALKTYLPNPVNEPSFSWKKIEPVLRSFGTTSQDVYDMYVEKYGASVEEGVPYEHVDGVDDLKDDGTLKDCYRYTSITTQELNESTGELQDKVVKYPTLDLVKERLNITDAPANVPIDAVTASMDGTVEGGSALPTVTGGNDQYSVNAVWAPAAATAAYDTTYTLTATFTAADGYEFTDTTTATLGSKAADTVSLQNGVLTATFSFTTGSKPIVNVESVGVAMTGTVAAGQALPTVTGGNNQYTVDAAWSPAAETADYETTYTLTATFTAKDGYAFTDTTTATLNGEAFDNVALQDGKVVATKAYTTEAQPTTQAPTDEPTQPSTDEPEPQSTFIAAGNPAEIFGTSWDATNEDNLMVANGDGSYSKSFTVDKAYDAVQVKTVKDGADWIGDETGNNVTFNLTGAGTFTVTWTPGEENEGLGLTTVSGDNVQFITEFVYDTVFAVGNGEGYWLEGAAWDPGFAANEMTQTSENVWEISYSDVPDGFERQVKFSIDGAWTHNFGGTFVDSGVETVADYNGENITFDTDDTCTIHLKLDLTEFDFTTKEGAKFTLTIDYDGGQTGTTTPAPDKPAVGIIGDVNNDGTVDINDATAIQRRGIELETFTAVQDALADTNGDGRISILDVTCIQKYLAEKTEGIGNVGKTLYQDGTIA